MAVKTQAQLLAEVASLLADNTTGDISALDLRTCLNDIIDSASYGGTKVYKALLTQTGTSAPVATVLVNTLGETPTYSYVGVADFRLIITGGLFIQAKTAMILAQNIGGGGAIDIIWNSTNDLAIETQANDVLNYTLVSIEVYP